LPFLHRFEHQDRVQGSPNPAGFHNGKRKDHAPAHYGQLRQASAGIDGGHQEGKNHCPVALCRIRRITGSERACGAGSQAGAAAAAFALSKLTLVSISDSSPDIPERIFCALYRHTVELNSGEETGGAASYRA
jgi:hypothetical protein